LPPYEVVTIYHLKDLIAGKKKTMSTDNVKYLYCPQYNSLSLKKIFRIIHEQNQMVLDYLPVEKEYEKFPRQYILNLIYSICGDGFRDFVQLAIKERNEQLALQGDLNIEMDPKIAECFAQSTMVSSKPYIPFFLLQF
jgi:hypothetical protein